MSRFFKRTKKEVGRKPLENQRGRPAFSYYAGDKPRDRDVVRERKQEEKREMRIGKLRVIPSVLAVLAIMLSAFYTTTLSTHAAIVFAGNSSLYRTKEDYKIRIGKLLDSSVKNRSKLFIDTAKTEAAIMSEFPELDVVKITLPVLGTRPTVTLHVRQPALILTTQTTSLVIDDNGRAVAETKSLMSSVRESTVTVQDQSGILLKTGDQALTTETVNFIKNAVAQLKNKNIVISQAVLPVIPNELDFRFKDIGYYIKTDTTGDARLQLGAFIAAKESGVVPSEYMDVRVEEKVFYK